MKILILMLSFFIFNTSLNAGDKEDVIKGVVLERISQFIGYEDVNDEFKICVYGDKKLVKSFGDLYKDRKYKGADIDILEVNSLGEIGVCDILYTRNLDKNVMGEILLKKRKQILLVTEDIAYVYNGFMVALYFEDKKLRFVINQTAISEADLKVNYRLLKVASKVINPVQDK